ncbi:Taurine dioxygenase, alpha-ketoglutarate-dependent [Enhydrobacter aerosaccus]|uniref:Taurine dioxygenase, alpha-ketoglutarate-dependent n=1 Tax=Enhydrobacter aerosaccus TaxID=225324 RepID=A0A1T4SWC8_9HYPH|nr:TauD/TfdA family dioxygenase [Enhydrobacter aerosaccus]SKA32446.1 Taurine dioxygenase, alpha-ketoglutarate-dependent [Enhydrobacter aerosaccus]
MVFFCSTRESFADRYGHIADHVASCGYAIIDAWDAETSTLQEIAEHFGNVQTHIRADANGLVGISTETIVNRDWEKFRSEYSGITSDEFMPHTDGSYLHGLVHRDGKYIQLLPPKMLVLQCWQSAAAGGDSILIDVQQVYDDLARENPGDLKILSTKGCVSYCRDDQIALDRAVFECLDDGAIMLRFRYDSTAYIADWASEAFHNLQRNYFSNPRYQVRLALAKGQIVVIDNYRMLHGRDSFSDGGEGKERKLRRVWLAYDRLPVLRNAADQHRERRALKRFEAYDIRPPAIAARMAPPRSIGIRASA